MRSAHLRMVREQIETALVEFKTKTAETTQ